MSFNGNSDELRQTQIVPTLDTPIEKGKNAIWCTSFLSSWKVLQQDIAGEPVQLEGAKRHCAPLNEADDPRNAIPEGALYVAAGWVQEGIIQTIRKNMQTIFPTKKPPSFPGIAGNSLLAYAYLEANISFGLPYFQSRTPFMFTDNSGNKTEVHSFGIRPEDDYAYFTLRNQPAVLYTEKDAQYQHQGFAVDLCRDSKPNQIVLACIEPRKSLAETIAFLEHKIKVSQNQEGLEANDVLLVPDLNWQLAHNFREFEGRPFNNAKLRGQRIDVARQDILFRLDRSGAELKSEAKQYCLPMPTQFLFDRPFLIYMKKRGANYPYFVMWADNAELLQPRDGAGKPQEGTNE
jgi:hypothetical protein